MSRAVKIIAAAALGFAAGLLLAPKSGEDTRRELKRKAREVKGYADEKTAQAREAFEDGYDAVRDGAREIGDELADFVGHARSSGEELAADAKTRSGRIASKAETTSKRVKSRMK